MIVVIDDEWDYGGMRPFGPRARQRMTADEAQAMLLRSVGAVAQGSLDDCALRWHSERDERIVDVKSSS